MADAKPTDCIYCGAPAGSAEHTILAALGGLRTDRGILCGPCNNGFGTTIDSVLAEDMKPINAILGVMNGRTREPIATAVEDPATGRTFVLSSGRRLDHPDAVVISDTTQNGVRSLHAVASTQKQADDFVHRLKGEGKPVKVTGRERVPHLFASTPTVLWNFGGTDTFRAVARLVLNILASYHPALAREAWLAPFKKFIREGGDHEPWVFYAYSSISGEAPVPPERFQFRHRFALMFDAEVGAVFARVSLLGIVELAVRLGKVSVGRSESLIYDMNVLAQSAPSDVAVSTPSGLAFLLPTEQTPDWSDFLPERLASVIARRNDRIWEEDAPALLAALNAARETEPSDRHDAIVQALLGQQQRLLNLAAFVASGVRRHLLEQFGEASGSSIGEAFGLLAQPDRASRTGVTELTHVFSEMLRYVMADHLLDLLNERPIETDELRALLEGGSGAAVVGKYMMEQVQRGHPQLREP